jgi:hypothetical protein
MHTTGWNLPIVMKPVIARNFLPFRRLGGLAFLLHVGSPQSKEGDDRKEEKIDTILEAVDPEKGKKLISEIDRRFARK